MVDKCFRKNLSMSKTSASQESSLDGRSDGEYLSVIENDDTNSCNNYLTGQVSTITEENTEMHHEWKAPDGGWGWFVVLGCFLDHFILGGIEKSSGVIYQQLLLRFSYSATATAWVISLPSTLRLLLGPLASALCDRFSYRFVVFLGAVFSLVGMFTSGFVSDLPYMFVTYGILGGVGRGFVYTPSIVAVGHYFDKKRGLAIGLSTSGVGLGNFVCPPIIEIMFNYYGFCWTFMILAAFMSNHFISAALYRPLALHWKIKEYIKKRTENETSINVAGPREQLLSEVPMENMGTDSSLAKPVQQSSSMIERKKTFSVKGKFSKLKIVSKSNKNKKQNPLFDISILKDFAFCALCMQLVLFTMSIHMTSLFLPALVEQKGMSNLEGAYLVSISGICNALSIVIVSFTLDLKRVKQYRLYIYNTIIFISAAVSILMPSLNNLWTFAVVSGLYGMLAGAYLSQKPLVVVDVVGVEKMSSAFGFLIFAQGLGNLVGSTAGGLFKDLLGNYDQAFYFGSMGIVAGAVVMVAGNIWIYRTRKRNLSKEMPEQIEEKSV